MTATINSFVARVAGGLALALGVAATAIAGSPGCNCMPPPSPPSPPSFNCCAPPTNNVIIPGVEVIVAPSVVVNANVQASAVAGAFSSCDDGFEWATQASLFTTTERHSLPTR